MENLTLKHKALDAYHLGLKDWDVELAFDGVGSLLGLTCPFEPRDKEGNLLDAPVVLDENEAALFLASGEDFERLAEGWIMGPEFVSFWQTIGDRIRV